MWFPYTLISKRRLRNLEMAKSFGEGWARGNRELLSRTISQNIALKMSLSSLRQKNETPSTGSETQLLSELELPPMLPLLEYLPLIPGTISRSTRRSRMRSSSLTNRGSWGRGPGRKLSSRSQSRTRGYSLQQLREIRGSIISQYSSPTDSTKIEPSFFKSTSSSTDSANFPRLIDSFKSEDSSDTEICCSSKCLLSDTLLEKFPELKSHMTRVCSRRSL